MATRKTKKFNIKKLVERLKEVREEDGIRKSPPPCKCEPISWGCKCGRFQWEMTQKEAPLAGIRRIASNPKIGDVYVISRPPNTDIDHGRVPFRIWAKCEGRYVEVESVEEDQNVADGWWCWCDVSHITKQGGDEHWFPNDSLLKIR